MKHSVQDVPLAYCDCTTLQDSDLVAADRPSREYVGEVYYVKYNKEQVWYYMDQQTPEEVSLISVYDSDPVHETAGCQINLVPGCARVLC